MTQNTFQQLRNMCSFMPVLLKPQELVFCLVMKKWITSFKTEMLILKVNGRVKTQHPESTERVQFSGYNHLSQDTCITQILSILFNRILLKLRNIGEG